MFNLFETSKPSTKIYSKITDDYDPSESVPLNDPSIKFYNTISDEKTVVYDKDSSRFSIGPFSHDKQIKFRSCYCYYLGYDEKEPVSVFNGIIFTIETSGNTFAFKHQYGYVVG